MFPLQNADARLWESEVQILIRQRKAALFILRKMSWQHKNAQKDQEQRSFEVVIEVVPKKSTNVVLVQLCDFAVQSHCISLACHRSRTCCLTLDKTKGHRWNTIKKVDTRGGQKTEQSERGETHRRKQQVACKTGQWHLKIKQEVLRHRIRQNYFFIFFS